MIQRPSIHAGNPERRGPRRQHRFMDDPYWLRRTLGAVITTAIATAGYGSGGCGGGAPGPTISVPLGLAPPSSSAGPELGPEPEQQACDVPAIVKACSLGLCGPNSADLSGFSVDPLSLNGCRNRERIRLIPGTLEGEPGRGCPAERMVLAIEHGKFVGREPSSGAGTACGADALAGATFWISGPAESMPITSTGPLGLDLYSVRTIRLKMKIQTIRNGDPGWYGIVPTGDALLPNGSSWDPTTVDVDMGLCKAGGSEALLVAGEAYSAAGTVIRGEELQQGWFHLACTDSALEHWWLGAYFRHLAVPGYMLDAFLDRAPSISNNGFGSGNSGTLALSSLNER